MSDHATPDLSIPPGLEAALGTAVLEQVGEDAFVLLGTPPDWFAGTLEPADADGHYHVAGSSPFLDDFVHFAEGVWAEQAEGSLKSEPWTEAGADGQERTLEAVALTVGGRPLLLLRPPLFPFEEAQRIFQKAREQALDYQLTRREMEEREVLLHCVVHDLSNPLAGIKGGLQILQTAGHVGESGQEVLQLTTEQADRMQGMIRQILHAFEAEVAALMPGSALPGPAPNVRTAARIARATLAARAEVNDVGIKVIDPPRPLFVAGDEERLVRMILNYLDNALRHSPRGSTVTISITEDVGQVMIAVEDQGPGVSEAQVPDLFQKFAQNGGLRGQAGLGLYFVRITAEGWGGSVGYERGRLGGARFWMRLPQAPEAA